MIQRIMADRCLIIHMLCCSIVVLSTRVHGSGGSANITFVENAIAKGAVCLDGTPAAYAYSPGFGRGADNWMIYLEGGGWCRTASECLGRSKSWLGSSVQQRSGNISAFRDFLDQDKKFNPDFYDWNKVYLLYCDGSSFVGDVEEVDPTTNLNYRGSRIFNAVMEELLVKGMNNAKNAVLAGTSAGGLATILHCDGFRELIPNAERVKCISDSGFFIHGKNLPGVELRENSFAQVVELHGMAKFLPESCTSRMNPGLCLFPENLVQDIRTPLFLLESAFDAWQIPERLIPAVGGKLQWANCIGNFTLCTPDQLQTLKDYRTTVIESLPKSWSSCSSGMFVHSCFYHGHILSTDRWRCPCVTGNTTIAKILGDWYFDRRSVQDIMPDVIPRNCSSTLNQVEIDNRCIVK